MPQKLFTLVAIAGLALSASAAHAQIGYGLSAGYSKPVGDFANVVDGGYRVAGLVTISPPLAPVGFRLEGSFDQFKYTDRLGTTTNANARILGATANAVLASPGFAGPYLIGGVGVYRATAECSGCTSSSTRAGFNGGLGFRFGLSGFSAFAEARLHYIGGASDPTNGGVQGSSTRFIPIVFGVTF